MSTQGSTRYPDEQTTQSQRSFGHEGQYQQQQGFGWTPQPQGNRGSRRKPFFATSEFLVLLASIAAVVIAAAVSNDFGAQRAWTLVTVLAAAYIVSRGLSKINRGDGTLDGRG